MNQYYDPSYFFYIKGSKNALSLLDSIMFTNDANILYTHKNLYFALANSQVLIIINKFLNVKKKQALFFLKKT